jgi:hypothetical protein
VVGALDDSEEDAGMDVVVGEEVGAEVGAAVVVGAGLGLPVVVAPGAVVGAEPTGALDVEEENSEVCGATVDALGAGVTGFGSPSEEQATRQAASDARRTEEE